MLTVTTFFYGLLASFVMASFNRNARAERGHPPILVLFGWCLFAFSAAVAPLLLLFAGLMSYGYASL